MKLSGKALAIWAAIALGLVVLIGLISIPISKTHGAKLQNGISAAYDRDRAKLGECVEVALKAAGYTEEQAKQMTNALIAANGGGGLMGASASPSGFSAIITKQQPDLAPYAAAFERGFNATVGCRKNFTKLQNELIRQVNDFRDWRDSSFTPAAWFGTWPNDKLEVKRPDNTFAHGQEAWGLVTTIITNSGANGAYNDGGNYDPAPPYGTPTPAAPASSKPGATPTTTHFPVPSGAAS